ncbi:uncharacterized protein DNG_03209 [Cephalotrichum gorgonifer]|uniref:N-acetyltransferase domain-containing protein n=1 Tax=Cephalotrichum gorgonifer TaxID=2041049 RepID=A0AAE8STS3_9PEZI|nr:uncharacterized protein DNG_03209 [Cephalotrichum gorgonifer]
MDLKLRLATLDDVEALCKTFFSGFADNLIAKYAFPPTSADVWDFWRQVMAHDIGDTNMHVVVVDDVSTTPPTLLAFGKWKVVQAEVDLPPPPTKWPEGGDQELAAAFFGNVWKKHVEIMSGRPHWCLVLLSTRKEFQRMGAGNILVKWGVEKADADGWECYLGSSVEARGLYEKYGFKEVDSLTYCNGEFYQSLMRRDKRQ